MKELMRYLETAVEKKASDIFMIAGAALSLKIGNEIEKIDERLLPADTKTLIEQVYTLAERDIEPYLVSGDDDFSFSIPGLARFRVNAYRQRGSLAMVVRVVSFSIPSYKECHIPESVMAFAEITSGMVLVTGIAGSGKSTTQACLIDKINSERSCHIVTLEDPIEYLHRNNKSIISQREITTDTEGYLPALRACLRQAPNVILLGEMRDYETIRTAMTAAETGHLVIATLHTNGAVNTLDRVIDSFPAEQQNQIRIQLSAVLRAVVSQRLLPCAKGGLVPAFELMNMTSAIRSMIRDSKTYQIDNAIASGKDEGMISMDQYIFELYKEGLVTEENAVEYADNPEYITRRIKAE